MYRGSSTIPKIWVPCLTIVRHRPIPNYKLTRIYEVKDFVDSDVFVVLDRGVASGSEARSGKRAFVPAAKREPRGGVEEHEERMLE